MLPSSSALVGGPRHGGVLQPVQASAAPQVPPETASRVAALCNTSSTLFDTEGAHAPPASPQLAMPDPAHAASGAVALQKEVEALRDECKQLESVTVSMRAAMLTLVTEVDALGVADKRAESELNAAKARATLASQRVARGQWPVEILASAKTRRSHQGTAGGLREEGSGPPEIARVRAAD